MLLFVRATRVCPAAPGALLRVCAFHLPRFAILRPSIKLGQGRLQVLKRLRVLVARETRSLIISNTIRAGVDNVLHECAIRLSAFLAASERTILPTDREPASKRSPACRVSVRVAPVVRGESESHTCSPCRRCLAPAGVTAAPQQERRELRHFATLRAECHVWRSAYEFPQDASRSTARPNMAADCTVIRYYSHRPVTSALLFAKIKNTPVTHPTFLAVLYFYV